MNQHQRRGWLGSLFARRRIPAIQRRAPRISLGLELFEERVVPSNSIPLNATTWTSIGPSPITPGQGPGNPSSTGRVNGIAVDPTNSNFMYVAADTGGIWSTTDGGQTWTPDTDQQQVFFQTIAMVHRASGNAVYAFDQQGNLWTSTTSTNGAPTFTKSSPLPAGSVVNKLVALADAADPTDQTKDVLYAAVGSILQEPPGAFPTTPNVIGSGIWRSMNGGATWTNIVKSTASPFTTKPASPVAANSLSFSDVVTDPTNANIVYAAVGNAYGDPTNGIYRSSNALSSTPTWTLLIGGSAFVPGESPGTIKLGISPSLPSEVFASLAFAYDPTTTSDPVLGVFRSFNSGVDWSEVTTPPNYLATDGFDNDVLAVATGSTNPNQQTVYLAGYNQDNTDTVVVSTDSGTTWTSIGVGGNGVGTYPNVHAAAFDSQGRLVLATGGGVDRLDSITPTVTWESLNGAAGAGGLDVAQFDGFALSPTDPNQAVGNVSFVGDLANTVPNAATGTTLDGPALHDAVLFSDAGTAAAAYGWQTVDATGIDNNVGVGEVLYDPYNANIVYRVVPGDIRMSTDGGLTWTTADAGLNIPASVIVPLAIDPSEPNRLFSVSGSGDVEVSNDGGLTWGTAVQIGAAGANNPVPAMPTDAANIPITAIGVGRESDIDFGGTGVNGVALFAATTDDVVHDGTTPDDDPTNKAAGTGPQLFVTVVPTNEPITDIGTTFDGHSWANLNVPGLTGNITQIVVDPTNSSTLYLFTSTGQVLRGTNFQFSYQVDANTGVIFGGAPDQGIETGTATWTNLTGNLPAGQLPGPPQDLALDNQVAGTPADDVLYAGSTNGVWKLTNPSGATTPVWTQVGLDASNKPSMPAVPVTALSLNTTTGILGAATYGRGVFELQVRGLISGHIFTDTNGSGVYVAGDPGIAGLTVEIVDVANNNSLIAVTTTDADGFYQFRSLTAGDYKVVVLGAPTGVIQTTNDPTTFSTFTQQSNQTVDFGFFTPGSISGTTFNDANDNGVKDAGETGVGGFTVFIDAKNDGTLDPGDPSVVSTANGSFTFTNLGPAVINGVANPLTVNGQYIVREAPLAGWLQTTTPLAAITLDSGQNVTGQLIGNGRIASIAGTVFIDSNGDGVQETGELGDSGITIQAVGPGGTLTTTTAADGSYSFPGLAVGMYTVTETLPSGFVQTTANPAPLTLGTFTHATGVNFGVFQTVTLSGEAFNDANANGTLDAGETGVGGFAIDLVNASTNAIVSTTTSGATGTFSFANVGPLPGGAKYALVEESKTGYVQTTTPPAAFALASGTNLSTFQFGTFRQYSVSGTAYVDGNGDGIQNNGDAGAAGFVIQLYNSSNTLVGTATTVANGTYTIAGIGPGAFTLTEASRAGYKPTEGATGYTLSGLNDVDLTGKDFGNAQVSTISGSAFVDTNGNGALDAGEGGAPGFTIDLSGPGGPQTAITATDGSYGFINLTAGTYTLTEVAQTGWTQTTANPVVITVMGSETVTGVTFGDFKNVTLSGLVFNDANDNGVLDAGESGLAAVTIDLTNATTAQVLATTTTGSTGAFSFANVGPLPGGADYAIREKPPTGTVQTTANPAAFALSTGTNVSTFQFGDAFREQTIVTADDAGGPPTVTLLNPTTGAVISSFSAYASSFTGGVRVATGFFTGGVMPDIVTAPGPGGGSDIRVFNPSGTIIAEFPAYSNFTGGVYVAVGDVNGDGVPDIITGADAGGGPHVKVFDGASLLKGQVKVLDSFYAYTSTFTGGVRVAAADIDGDGHADIITGAGPGGGPHVEVFSGANGQRIRSFYAYAPTVTAGVYVAAGDVTGSGQQDIITGPGSGGPDVRVFDGATNGTLLSKTYAFPPVGAGTLLLWSSGLRVATTVEPDGKADIIVAPGAGEQSYVRVLDGETLDELTPPGQLTVSDPSFLGGIFVGGS